MTLAAGTRLGPYEILSPIGAGGMGEVYRAKDPRLGRDVAIKVLPPSFSSDPDRLKRFEQEARAAGVLNHPNITAVHDLGTHEGAPYVVQELLEGETLRAELVGGRFPHRKALDYAIQIAHGLAAAHEKGIVHRDLKPENVFVTKSGRVKILDFGLAKLTQVEGAAAATNIPTATEPGVVMGTLGYMSPEQVKAKPADARSDIFAFGAILYEMLSGQRAFRGDSAGETMASILKEDPPDLSVTNQSVSPGLERIVRHCIEKSPERRFQSASDIAFNLESLSVAPSGVGASRPISTTRTRRVGIGAAAGAALALLVAGLLAGAWLRGGEPAGFPRYRQLTFQHGFVNNARFAPDGSTIVYSADWDGQPSRLFTTRTEGHTSTPLPLPDAMLLSVSSHGDLALLLSPVVDYNLYVRKGTLAVVPLSGGTPRELLRDARAADFGPDGKDIAAVVQVGARQRLEYPIGHVVHESGNWIGWPRVSRGGDLVAFWGGLPFNGYPMEVVDRGGRVVQIAQASDFWDFAWSPDGREIWVPEASRDYQTPITAIDLGGRRRLLQTGAASLDIFDVSADGRALVGILSTQSDWNRGRLAGQTAESRLVSRTDFRAVDVSRDGKVLALREATPAETEGTWLARGDGSAPVRLGDGVTHGLSPDSAWVLASRQGRLTALPTAAGSSRILSDGFFGAIRWASFLPDGRGVIVWGNAKGEKSGIFLLEESKPPRRVAPEGYEIATCGNPVSPDGRLVAARSPENAMMICPLAGGAPRGIPGLSGPFVPVQWSTDGKDLFVFRTGDVPARVERVDVETGRRAVWKELTPPDLAGVTVRTVVLTPDGEFYAYSSQQLLNSLYLADNLASWRRPTFWARLLGAGR